jgi:hypothetical protein
MRPAKSTLKAATAAALTFGLLMLVGASASSADTPPAAAGPVTPDRFKATTTAMTPRDATVRFDVREWSDEDARAAVLAALSGDADAQKELASLPTIGYAWVSNSSVGYALKYAYRSKTAEGERITFVTDKRLGAYDFKPWVAEAPAATPELHYSVIELYLNGSGHGDGTMSLVAGVDLDSANAVLTLKPGAPRVLANATSEAKRTWGSGD